MRNIVLAALAAALAASAQSPEIDPEGEGLLQRRIGNWVVGPTHFSCAASSLDGDLTLSRYFEAPERAYVEFTGPFAAPHAGRDRVVITARFFRTDGGELGRLSLPMRASEQGANIWNDNAPGDLFRRLRAAARVAFSGGAATLDVDLGEAGAALDELDRCLAEHQGTGE